MTILQMPGNMKHTSGAMGKVDLVVIHATVSPCVTGGARANARYFKTAAAGGLAQYVVDPDFVIRTCPETVAGWHAPPVNERAIGVELCDPQAGRSSRWGDADHRSMLLRAAGLVADICARHDVPVRHVDPAGLRAGKRGITRHMDVSKAFGLSDHSDPGPAFPLDHFLDLVRGGTPAPQEDDMPLSDEDVAKVAKAAAELVRKDIVTLLRGDAQHPYNIESIGKAVGVKP